MKHNRTRPVGAISCARILTSFAAIVSMFAVLHSLIRWNYGNNAKQGSSLQRYLLQEEGVEDNIVSQAAGDTMDDDITRDQTCRQYLRNFLNGTTDAKDVCQGMYNAWQAGDCKDETGINNINVFSDENTTDDVLIDDFYENFECCSTISSYYSRHCQVPHLDASKLLMIVMVLVTCGFMKSMIRIANVQWIPDAGVCILVGSVVGGILRITYPDFVGEKLVFDNDLFLQVLLPPIIFEAALSIEKRAFRRDLFPILTFAIFGTGLSAVAIGYITHIMSSWGGGTSLPLLDSLIFGALMSSIDPVATLGILSSVGVGRSETLYTLVFGESLLNDGVSIVLFDSLIRHMGDSSVVDVASLHDTLYHFFFVISGSILVGFACGGVCTMYFFGLQGKFTPVTEVAMFFSWALIPYYVADGMGLSGIIAIMVMGFMMDFLVIGGFQSEERTWMDHMRLRCESDEQNQENSWFSMLRITLCKALSGCGHVTARSRRHVGFVAEVISSLMETAIFAYLGLFLFNDKDWNIFLTFDGIIACITSRAGMVVSLSLLVNLCVWIDLEANLGRLVGCIFRLGRARDDDESYTENRRSFLSGKTQFILFTAGVRGAVSYALVQNIPVYDSVTKHGSHFKGELKAMTSAIIVILIFVFGALTYFTMQGDTDNIPETRDENALGERLIAHRGFSILASDDENDNELLGDESNNNPSAFEIDSRHPSFA